MNEPLRIVIARCRNRDEAAVGELVARFRGWGLDLAVALLSDASLAEDAVQEAFVTALLRLDDLRNADAFAGWFRQIVRTQANRIRRSRRDVPLGCEIAYVEGAVDDSSIERNELRAQVRSALRALPPVMRDTAELFYLEERTCAEIADRLSVPRGTVRRRLHDARNQLRERLINVLEERDADALAREQRLPTNERF